MKQHCFFSRIKLFIIMFLVLFITSCADSQFLLDRGKRSYDDKEYRKAYIRLLPVAKAGNAEAQYALGYMYYNGQGITEDKKVGIEWMEKAAKQNNREAIRALSIIRSTPPSPYQPKGREIIGDGR